METNFWREKSKPLIGLSPMDGVTDAAFRYITDKYGKPDILFTEFTSVEGLARGAAQLLTAFIHHKTDTPTVAQVFGATPQDFYKAAFIVAEMGFDGIDINMGCPDKSVEKQGAGSAHIKNPDLAQKVIFSAMEGAKKNGKNIPVSVKTRIGYNKNELETWLPKILETNPAVVTIHARTRKEMSLVPARWEHVKRAVEIRDSFIDSNGNKSQTLIFGNGDVLDIEDAERKVKETGCDGVMLGRAIFGNPWCFSRTVKREDVSIPDRLRVMVEHTKLFEDFLPHKSFAIMKKHYKAYVNGWDGAKELRLKLMETKTAGEVEEIVEEYLATL